MPYTPTAADVAAVLAAAAYLVKRFLSRAGSAPPPPLPPGPAGLPLIGNVLDIPQVQPHITYMEWAKKYGPIMHVSVFGKSLIIINSMDIATELLGRRATSSSGRATFIMVGVLAGWNSITPMIPYNAHWRAHRRYMNAFVGAHVVEKRHAALLERAARQMALRLMCAPGELEESIRAMTGSVILKITYGYETQAKHDPLVTLVADAVKQLSDMSDTKQVWAVDLLPILQHIPAWVPGAGFKRTAAEGMETSQKMAQVPFDAVKAKMREGTAESCMVADLLAECESADDEHDIKWAAATMFAGGADTTTSTLLALFLCLTLYPGVQKKAQAELDTVIGRARLPTLADRPSLPYIDAIVSEVLRWCAIFPLAIPHRFTQEEFYNGYRLPADAIILPNIWAMLRDPAVYANPDVFEPERFLASDGKSADPDPRAAFFGFGRRVCPGQALADANVWAATATVLATLSISKARDECGAEITPEVRFTEGMLLHPAPFEYDIKPRFVDTEALISNELEQYKLG